MEFASLLPLVALLLWGLWATVVKYGTIAVNPVATAIGINLFAIPFYLIYGKVEGYELVPTNSRAFLYIGAAGLFSAGGTIAYYTALSRGVDTSTATTVSALYFVVPVVLSVSLLSESITSKELVGIVAAFIATILLTT